VVDKPEVLTIESGEVQAALRSGNRAQLEEWISSGRYKPHHLNPYRVVIAEPKAAPADVDDSAEMAEVKQRITGAPAASEDAPAAPADSQAKLNFHSPEVQAALARGDRAQLATWIAEGRYESQPGNPYAPGGDFGPGGRFRL
jgi:hypothetical protein